MEPLEYFSPFRQTCVDLQHQICIGTGKELFYEIIHSDEFGKDEKKSFNDFIVKCQLSTIFQRAPRPIEEFNKYKANEMYTLINLTGVPALNKAGIKGKRFELIARFAAFIQLVVSPNYTIAMEETVSRDLLEFAEDCHEFYGTGFMTYNFHQITNHLLDGIYEIGPLHITSCFVSESFMGIAKRMQKQFFKVFMEITGKLALFDCADLMEEFITKPSPSDDVQELRFSRRELHKNCRTIEENGRKTYVLGTGTDLLEYLLECSNVEQTLLKDAISAEFGEAWEGRLEITVHKSAISQYDFRMDRRRPGDVPEEKKRSNCCVQLANGEAIIILSIICVNEPNQQEKAFIYGKRLKGKKWNYFDLDKVLKRDIYKNFYRLVDEEPCVRILTNAFNVQLPVVMFPDLECGTVIAPVFLPVPS